MAPWHTCELCGFPIENGRKVHDICMLDVQAMYQARRDRSQHPEGRFDKAGRWYPSEHEQCECCNVRTPSRAYPYSLMVHCRTLRHCKQLYFKQVHEDARVYAAHE